MWAGEKPFCQPSLLLVMLLDSGSKYRSHWAKRPWGNNDTLYAQECLAMISYVGVCDVLVYTIFFDLEYCQPKMDLSRTSPIISWKSYKMPV